MSKRHKRRAKTRRLELMMLLGFICNHCGHKGTKKNALEFDCIVPQGDEHHRLDTERRMIFYFRQYREKNLQILCRKCNNTKSHEDRKYLDALNGTEQPEDAPVQEDTQLPF